MSDTAVLSALDRNPVSSIHYLPDFNSNLSHLSDKFSSWTSQSSSMMENLQPQSFTARRPAASSLPPTFQLPPPPQDHLAGQPRYPTYTPTTQTQPTPTINSVPTPPGALPNNDLSPVNSNSSSAGSANGPSYHNSTGYWPTPQPPSNPLYQYSSAPSLSTMYSQSSYNNRNPFPPSIGNFHGRGPNSPQAEALPGPPYEINHPPFPSGGGQSQNLPNLAPQQMSNNGLPSSQASSQGAMHAPDHFARPPPSPYYGTPSSTPQQSTFPAFTHHSPHQSPNTSGPRISPISAHSMHAPQQSYTPRPYPGYSLPAMAGPIMSNVHSPGNQMALVGGPMQMGYPPQIGQHMYTHHQGQQSPQGDRPFKCDQCPQSFNRNHDLKRHKRIHLAVKPFPCEHCEKSFSRKDALKVRSDQSVPLLQVQNTDSTQRHRLVKGCGKNDAGVSSTNGNSQSPGNDNDRHSDAPSENSPTVVKKDPGER